MSLRGITTKQSPGAIACNDIVENNEQVVETQYIVSLKVIASPVLVI